MHLHIELCIWRWLVWVALLLSAQSMLQISLSHVCHQVMHDRLEDTWKAGKLTPLGWLRHVTCRLGISWSPHCEMGDFSEGLEEITSSVSLALSLSLYLFTYIYIYLIYLSNCRQLHTAQYHSISHSRLYAHHDLGLEVSSKDSNRINPRSQGPCLVSG